ncbi:unnamed protein product [Cylicocyclus nassatus]|uniref:Uncharacterized protein n=1 Tax=Cylicocyclus nassatus TaxID=53992 RepID=A0AA36M4B2_CYLNA|nr:unnamed protein product [Cylicocyclus nassatus]
MDRDEENEYVRQELQHLQQAIDQLPKPGKVYDDIVEAAKQLSATRESLQSILPKMTSVRTVHEQAQVQIMKCQLLIAELEKTRLQFLLIQTQLKSLYDTANLLINTNVVSRLEWNAMLQTAADGPNEILLNREALEEVIEEQLKLLEDYKNTLNNKRREIQEEKKLERYDLEDEMRHALCALRNACENVLQTPKTHDDEEMKKYDAQKTDKRPPIDTIETQSLSTETNTYQEKSKEEKTETTAEGASQPAKGQSVRHLPDSDESQRQSKDMEQENVVSKPSEEGEEERALQPSQEGEEVSKEGLNEDADVPARADDTDEDRDHPESRGDEESQPLLGLIDDERNQHEGDFQELPRLVDDDEMLELIDELYDEESPAPRASPEEAEDVERGERAEEANNEAKSQDDHEQRNIEEGRSPLEIQREKREIQLAINELNALIRQLEERPTCPPRRLQNRAIYREADRFIRCACPPTPAPSTPPSTTTASSTSSSAPSSDATTSSTTASTASSSTGGAKKREVTKVEVTVITNQKYDPLLNDSHLQVFRMLLNDYLKVNGITYNKDLVREQVKNEGGNFAVRYTVLGGDCARIKYLVANGERHAEFIENVIVKC